MGRVRRNWSNSLRGSGRSPPEKPNGQNDSGCMPRANRHDVHSPLKIFRCAALCGNCRRRAGPTIIPRPGTGPSFPPLRAQPCKQPLMLCAGPGCCQEISERSAPPPGLKPPPRAGRTRTARCRPNPPRIDSHSPHRSSDSTAAPIPTRYATTEHPSRH